MSEQRLDAGRQNRGKVRMTETPSDPHHPDDPKRQAGFSKSGSVRAVFVAGPARDGAADHTPVLVRGRIACGAGSCENLNRLRGFSKPRPSKRASMRTTQQLGITLPKDMATNPPARMARWPLAGGRGSRAAVCFGVSPRARVPACCRPTSRMSSDPARARTRGRR